MSLISTLENSEESPVGVSILAPAEAGGNLTAWREKRAASAKSLMGMPIVPVLYQSRSKTFIRVGTQYVDSLRHEAKQEKTAFVKWLGASWGTALKEDLGFSDQQITAMITSGTPPSGYDVHHRMPLGGCRRPDILRQANDFDNLVLIKIDHEHRAIHDFVQPQLDKLSGNGIVYLPVPVGYWQKPLLPEQLAALGQNDWRDVCDYEITRKSALGLAIEAGREFLANRNSISEGPQDKYFECTARIMVTARPKRAPKSLSRSPKNQRQPALQPVLSNDRACFIQELVRDDADSLQNNFNLTAAELEEMRCKGRLPKRLVLIPRLPVRYCGTDAEIERALVPRNMVLTTRTIKHELDRQFRKQLRDLKKGETTIIIMPVFDKPWFGKAMSLPDMNDIVERVQQQQGFYPPIAPDVDIEARYQALYEKPAPVEPPILEKPTLTKQQQKKKPPPPPPDVFINAPYFAFEVMRPPPPPSPPSPPPVPVVRKLEAPPSSSRTKQEATLTHEMEFVRWVTIQSEEQLRQDFHLTNHDLEAMKTKGTLPKHLTVGHQVPLRACGDDAVFERYDRFDNMVILPVDMLNRFNKIIKSQISGMHPGQTKMIDLPVIPGHWPRKMTIVERDEYGPALVQGFETSIHEQNTALALVMAAARGRFKYPQSTHMKNTSVLPPDSCPLPRPHW